MIFVVGSFVAACSVKVDRLPAPGESVLAESLTLEPGGKGFNVAVAAHRLGAQVDGILAIGSDSFANLATDAIAKAGLPMVMLVRFPGSTGAGFGMIDRRGENCIAVAPGANALLSTREIMDATDRLRRARFVVAQFETGDAPILAAFERAHRIGATTVLNPSPFRSIAIEMLRETDVLIVNQTEAHALASTLGLNPEDPLDGHESWAELADRLFVQGVGMLVVTLGPGGAIARTSRQPPIIQPAYIIDAIDAIGAGDAFLGGFVAGLAEDRELADALRQGVACGAFIAARLGVVGALPTSAEIEQFIASHQTAA